MSKNARKAACSGIGAEIDKCNAHSSLLRNYLDRQQVLNTFPMIDLYCKNFENLRYFIAEYYPEDTNAAKKRITRMFYGGTPE